MNSIPDSLPAELNDKLRGRVVFVGIGNLLKGDDALGPKLVEGLASKGLKTVDAGTTPENYIGKVASMEPDTVVLIDAVHLDSKPGSVELLEREDILGGIGFTTHTQSPAMVMERLELETGAAVLMLAVQPASLTMGAELTPAVQNTLNQLTKILGDQPGVGSNI